MKARPAVHGTVFTGSGMQFALLVTALLFPATSFAADFLNDLLRKKVDAAAKELKQRVNLPPAVPASTPHTPPSGGSPGASAQPSGAPQSPAPQSSDLHPDEINFVAPSATERVSQAERCISLRWDGFDTKARCPSHKPVENAELMKGEPRASYPSEFLSRTSPRMIVDNPYLSLDRGFFNKIRGAACNPDGTGELWVTATAWLKRNQNPYASGIWKVAPDGRITPLSVKPWALERSRYRPYCNAPFQKSSLEVDNLTRLTPATDGSMLAISNDPTYSAISRILADGSIEYIAGGGPCAAAAAQKVGYVDGSVAVARFKAILAALEDPQKNIWVGDFGNCALRKISGGQVTTVVGPERACPKKDPWNHLVFDHFAWDPKAGDLIAAGTHLWRGPPTGDDYFSSVWRISADGAMKRLYVSKAEGSGPNDGFGSIEGLAVDRAGAIWFAQSYFGMKEGTKIMRIGADAKLVHVAGLPMPGNVNHGDGPAREALFASMSSMCFDSQDTLFMYGDNMIRKMTRDGRVTTWAY